MNIRKISLLISLPMIALWIHGQDADITTSTMTEIDLLDGATITVTLTGDQFVRTGSLSTQAFTPINAPSGLMITSGICSTNSRWRKPKTITGNSCRKI